MDAKDKAARILLNVLPVAVMVGIIPLVTNDYALTGVYLAIIAASLAFHREPLDFPALAAGFLVMIPSEYFFVSTGVERFARNSLFGVMPIWLPVLWAYAFVVMKRGIALLGA